MIDVCRRFLCIGLASLLFIGLSGMSLAEPNEGQNMNEPREVMCPPGWRDDAAPKCGLSHGRSRGSPV